MPSVYAPCSACGGTRYNEATLEVLFRDKSIADVLAMSVDQAGRFFGDYPAIHRPLQLLEAIGLGYLCLGRWRCRWVNCRGRDAAGRRIPLRQQDRKVSCAPPRRRITANAEDVRFRYARGRSRRACLDLGVPDLPVPGSATPRCISASAESGTIRVMPVEFAYSRMALRCHCAPAAGRRSCISPAL
jgi:hypothetical protein